MMSEEKKRSKRNIVYGLSGQIITMVLGFIIPRLILVNYGSETNGLINSVAQICTYVALLEAGVGGATMQALYNPVAQNDRGGISSLMSATHKYYLKVGYIYVAAVALLAFIYPIAVKSELSYFTVFFVIIFNGMGGAINFLFQGKYYLLLEAEGKNYIKANVDTASYLISNIIKITLIYLRVNIVFLQLAFFVVNIAQMLFVVLYMKAKYPWLNLRAKPDNKAISQKNSVMVHQLSSFVFGNTDSVILTFFCGLKEVSLYSMPGMCVTKIYSLLQSISGSILFILGQSFQNNKKKFMHVYDVLETFYYAAVNFSVTMFFIFINPFLALFTRGVTDINYIDPYLPYLFAASTWLSWSRMPSVYVVNNCAGHFKQTKNRAIIESVINIVVSIAGVCLLGIYGVLIGTIVALLYRTNDYIMYSAANILERSASVTYKRMLTDLALTIVCCFVGSVFLPAIDSYLTLVIYMLIYAVIIFAAFVLLNFITERRNVKSFFDSIFKKGDK